ncbi:MAG TPA: FHA domain-containing protein [Elainellaceae cyanobacterium]
MSNLNFSDTSASCPLSFLEQNPAISDSLFADCNHNLAEVTTIIEPVLKAHQRCQITSFYIQAVTTGRTAFLATNMPDGPDVQATDVASSWLIGRSSTCAVTVLNRSVSRRHAVIGHHSSIGFYVTDVGSSNGTWVNRRKLAPMERRSLQDGDLLQLGSLKAEFFIASRQQVDDDSHESTYSLRGRVADW